MTITNNTERAEVGMSLVAQYHKLVGEVETMCEEGVRDAIADILHYHIMETGKQGTVEEEIRDLMEMVIGNVVAEIEEELPVMATKQAPHLTENGIVIDGEEWEWDGKWLVGPDLGSHRRHVSITRTEICCGGGTLDDDRVRRTVLLAAYSRDGVNIAMPDDVDNADVSKYGILPMAGCIDCLVSEAKRGTRWIDRIVRGWEVYQ